MLDCHSYTTETTHLAFATTNTTRNSAHAKTANRPVTSNPRDTKRQYIFCNACPACLDVIYTITHTRLNTYITERQCPKTSAWDRTGVATNSPLHVCSALAWQGIRLRTPECREKSGSDGQRMHKDSEPFERTHACNDRESVCAIGRLRDTQRMGRKRRCRNGSGRERVRCRAITKHFVPSTNTPYRGTEKTLNGVHHTVKARGWALRRVIYHVNGDSAKVGRPAHPRAHSRKGNTHSRIFQYLFRPHTRDLRAHHHT